MIEPLIVDYTQDIMRGLLRVGVRRRSWPVWLTLDRDAIDAGSYDPDRVFDGAGWVVFGLIMEAVIREDERRRHDVA